VLDPRAAGTYTVTVSAKDGTISSSTTFTWTVNDTTPPALTNPGTQTSNEGASVHLALLAVDADSFTATGLPTGLSINATTGVISGTLDPRGTGSYAITVTATDNGHTTSVSFTWNVADTTPPVLVGPGPQTSNQGDTISLGIGSVDADPGTFSASGLPAGLSINANSGLISGSIFAPPGTYQVTVSAADGNAQSLTSFTWVVNQMATTTAITSVQNTYVGLYQVETVTAHVTNSAGVPINYGAVTFQLNGQTMAAPVSNGFATVTFVTPLLSSDFSILMNDFFTHPLDVAFSDPAGLFGGSSNGLVDPPMLLDFFLFLLAGQNPQLVQQLSQNQS
jgi:hypothetical protein